MEHEQLYVNSAYVAHGQTSQNHKFKVALDIGSTYFGYAFAPVENPRDVTLNKNWAAELGYEAWKAPTCVFGSEDGKRFSAGFKAFTDNELEAEQMRSTLPSGLHLNFPYQLSVKYQRKDKDTVKNRKLAIKAMAHMIKFYLKDHILRAINEKYNSKINVQEIKWMISVHCLLPGDVVENLNDKLKRAGIQFDITDGVMQSTHAAFLHCMSLPTSKKKPKKALVINAGGIFIDITLFEHHSDSYYQPQFDDSIEYGGNVINEYFTSFLASVLGKEFIRNYKEHVDWHNFMGQFEQVKQAASPKYKSSFQISLSPTFGEIFARVHGEKLELYLKTNAANIDVKSGNFKLDVKHGKLVIPNKRISIIYERVMSRFSSGLNVVMGDEQCNSIDKIYLTGGFASSLYVQMTVRDFFGNVQVVIPENANMADIRGCLMKGLTGAVNILQ